MKLLRLLLLLTLTLPAQSLLGQIIYRGTITDDKKRPLPLVTVKLMIENTESASNQNGQFNITSLSGVNDTLLFSSVGYETKKISTIDFKQNSKIILPENILSLNDVNIAGGKKKTHYRQLFRVCPGELQPRYTKTDLALHLPIPYRQIIYL